MQPINIDLQPEMVEQEVTRYYRDQDGKMYAKTETILVPTGRLIPKTPENDKKE